MTSWWHRRLPVGEFAIALPAGSYRACFDEARLRATTSGRRCWSDGYDVFGGTDIVVTEGGTTTIAPAAPARDARCEGRIVGAGRGRRLGVRRRRTAGRPTGPGPRSSASRACADGSFVRGRPRSRAPTGSASSTCRASTSPSAGTTSPPLAEADEVTVPPGRHRPDPLPARPARQHLRHRHPAARLDGVRSTSAPTGSATVDGSRSPSPPVGPDGGYRITGLDADTYRVCADGYDILRTCWRQGSEPDAGHRHRARHRSVPQAGRPRPRPGRLRDRHPARRLPRRRGLPERHRLAPGRRRLAAVASGESVPTGIGSDWTYEVGSLPTGTYVVCVEHIEPEFVTAFPRTCNGGSPSPQGGIPFEVVAGATTSGIDIATGQAGEIRGGVLGSPAPGPGRPLRADRAAGAQPVDRARWPLPVPRAPAGRLPRRLPPRARPVVARGGVVAQPRRRCSASPARRR